MSVSLACLSTVDALSLPSDSIREARHGDPTSSSSPDALRSPTEYVNVADPVDPANKLTRLDGIVGAGVTMETWLQRSWQRRQVFRRPNDRPRDAVGRSDPLMKR